MKKNILITLCMMSSFVFANVLPDNISLTDLEVGSTLEIRHKTKIEEQDFKGKYLDDGNTFVFGKLIFYGKAQSEILEVGHRLEIVEINKLGSGLVINLSDGDLQAIMVLTFATEPSWRYILPKGFQPKLKTYYAEDITIGKLREAMSWSTWINDPS